MDFGKWIDPIIVYLFWGAIILAIACSGAAFYFGILWS